MFHMNSWGQTLPSEALQQIIELEQYFVEFGFFLPPLVYEAWRPDVFPEMT